MASKYDWSGVKGRSVTGGAAVFNRTQQEQNLAATDPANIKKSLEGIYGPQLASLLAEQMAETFKNHGLTNVDRRHLAFPESQASFDETDVSIDPRGWEIPAIRSRRLQVMKGFFRHALFGTSFKSTLPGASDLLVRELSTTDADGGYLIPPGYIYEVMRDALKLSMLFKYVRKIPVGGLSGTFPKVGTNATVYWGTENANIQQGDPAFANTTYSVNRMNALVMLSREIASDANPNIVQTVTELFQEAMAYERDAVVAVGNGSGKPLGIYSQSGIIDVAVTTLTYTNLVKIKESVDQRYQDKPTFRWMFNQNVKAAIMEILDGYGRPIFMGPTDKEPGRILGCEYSVERAFPNNFIGIGDLSYYVWFDRQQYGIEKTTEGGDAFLNHQLWIKFFERADGKCVLPPTVPFARSRLITGVTTLTPVVGP